DNLRLGELSPFVPRAIVYGQLRCDQILILCVKTIVANRGVNHRIAEGLGIALPVLRARSIAAEVQRELSDRLISVGVVRRNEKVSVVRSFGDVEAKLENMLSFCPRSIVDYLKALFVRLDAGQIADTVPKAGLAGNREADRAQGWVVHARVEGVG